MAEVTDPDRRWLLLLDFLEEYGQRYLGWELHDPAGQGIAVRPVRDETERKVKPLLDGDADRAAGLSALRAPRGHRPGADPQQFTLGCILWAWLHR